jgi:hypothetical protein
LREPLSDDYGTSVSAPLAAILVATALTLGAMLTATVAGATHKGTHHYYHHGIGDFGDADAFVHPFLAEVSGTSRTTYVAYGDCYTASGSGEK